METHFSALVGKEACFSAHFEPETGFSALVATDRRFSALAETGFSALVATDRQFSALAETGFSALVATDRRFSALVEVETHVCFLVEAEPCFPVHLLLHFHFLEVRRTSADGARGGSEGVASCGGCDVILMATCAAFAMGGLCGCRAALAKAVCAASAVRGKCQSRGPVSSRQPERRGWPLG